MKPKKPWALAVLLIILIGVGVWIAWGNSALTVHEIQVESEKIPKSFSGFRIAQVSDLHNAEFGKDNQKLIDQLKRTDPDIIVLTGDIVDSYRTDVAVALAFARQAVLIAPIYYVNGNHESRIDAYEALCSGLEEAGVKLLLNDSVRLEQEGEYITLLGVQDPSFQSGSMEQLLGELLPQDDTYMVLLSHRPELFDAYVRSGVDLIFTGHAHGGQFRIPFVGGLFAPGQGLFPKYDAGLYSEDDTNMIVSRGLGNSLFPFRINNRPEIIVAELVSVS